MKNFNTLFLICLFTFCSIPLFSNELSVDSTKYNKIEANVSYYNLGSVDELYSYSIYSGSGLAYGLKYMNGNQKKNHQLTLRYAMIDRTPKSLNLDVNLFSDGDPICGKNSLIFEAFDSYRFLLEEASSNVLRLYATGTWLTTINITTNANSLPELIQSGLAAGLYSEANIKNHRFKAELFVPFVSWTVRNSYSLSMTQNYEKMSNFAFIKQNSQIQFPNSLLAVYSTFGYGYAFSKHFSVEGEYNFRYMLNTSPRPLKSVSGIYSFGLIYTF